MGSSGRDGRENPTQANSRAVPSLPATDLAGLHNTGSWDHSKKGAIVLAYSFPLLSIFWSMLIFFGLFLMIWLIIWCFIDNFRRRDHHGLAKAGWTVVILFIPILGALIYIVARPASASLERL